LKRQSILKPIFICALLFSSGFTATAWGASDAELTLPEALQLALQNDYAIIAAQYDVEKARLAVKAEALKIFPQASVETSFGYDANKNEFPTNIVITIKETIPSKYHAYGSVVASALDAALWDQVNSECQLQVTQASVMYNTTVLYLNVLKYQKTQTIQETAAQKAHEADLLAQAELKLGQITKPTQLKTESDLAQAEFNLEQNRQNLLLAVRQLGSEIGRPELSQVKLTEPELGIPDQPNYGLFKSEAAQRRLEIQQAQIAIRKAERLLAQANNNTLPALNLSLLQSSKTYNVTAGYNFLSGDISWSAALRENLSELFSDVESNNTFRNRSGITLKWIWKFDFGLAHNLAMQAQLNLNSSRSNQAKVKQDLMFEIDQVASAYQLALLQTATNRRGVPYYEKMLEIKALEFQLGTATKLDLFTAEIDLAQAQVNVIKADYDQMAAYQKLLLAAGRSYPFKSGDR
jgi:outer membrane protein TolC